MKITRVEQDPKASVGHVGLALISEMARVSGAELKSEMDMERLPSGKFVVNSAFLLLGMLVYNMLKVVGRGMVFARALG